MFLHNISFSSSTFMCTFLVSFHASHNNWLHKKESMDCMPGIESIKRSNGWILNWVHECSFHYLGSLDKNWESNLSLSFVSSLLFFLKICFVSRSSVCTVEWTWKSTPNWSLRNRPRSRVSMTHVHKFLSLYWYVMSSHVIGGSSTPDVIAVIVRIRKDMIFWLFKIIFHFIHAKFVLYNFNNH